MFRQDSFTKAIRRLLLGGEGGAVYVNANNTSKDGLI
jgi:hypothetical protein